MWKRKAGGGWEEERETTVEGRGRERVEEEGMVVGGKRSGKRR